MHACARFVHFAQQKIALTIFLAVLHETLLRRGDTV